MIICRSIKRQRICDLHKSQNVRKGTGKANFNLMLWRHHLKENEKEHMSPESIRNSAFPVHRQRVEVWSVHVRQFSMHGAPNLLTPAYGYLSSAKDWYLPPTLHTLHNLQRQVLNLQRKGMMVFQDLRILTHESFIVASVSGPSETIIFSQP